MSVLPEGFHFVDEFEPVGPRNDEGDVPAEHRNPARAQFVIDGPFQWWEPEAARRGRLEE
jgi:hypothetical protein